MRPVIRLGVITLIAGLTLIACASGGTSGGAAATTVTIKGSAFGPASVTVARGQTVRFQNDDAFAHTVTSGAPPTKDGKFDKEVGANASTTITFDAAGTFTYFCNIHPTMRGTVVVN